MSRGEETKPLKICHIADLNEIHCRRYIGYFVSKGANIISVINCRPLKNRGLMFVESNEKCNIFDVSSGVSIPFFRHFVALLKIKKALRRIKPDIVYVHSAGIYAFLSVLTGFRPIVVFPWGSDVLIEPKKSRIIRWAVQYVMRKASLITPSSEVAAKACVQLGAAKERVRIIQVGIDLNKFRPGLPVGDLRKELDIAADDPVVISVRDFRKLYNISDIVECIPQVLSQIPKVKFVFLRGPKETEEKTLRQLLNKYGIDQAVRFVGCVDHEKMPLYYNLAKLVVSVPTSDSSPNSLHEAMACGLAPIVSDIPANRYWVEEGINGEIVPLHSAQELANKIVGLLKDNKKMETYSRINLKVVEDKLDKEKWIDLVESWFLSLIGSGA